MKKDASEYNESELIRLISGTRKESAFAMKEVYSRFSENLYRFIIGILNNDQFAEDILQNTFVKCYESIRQGNKVKKLRSFLYRIARNLCINDNKLKEGNNIQFDEMRYKDESNIEDIDKELMIDNLNRALEKLPLEFREVIVMKDFLNYKYHEIADILGTNLNVVRIRIYRAKQMLREHMEIFNNEIKNYNI